jgi:hypothetical protein
MHERLETLMAHPVWCIQQVKIPLTGQEFVLWLGLLSVRAVPVPALPHADGRM